MGKYNRSIKFIWSSFKGHKKLFYVFFVGKILEGIFYVIFPVLAKLEMDQLVEKNEQLFGIIQLSSFNIFLLILVIIFSFKLIENIIKSFIDLFEFDYLKMYDNFYSEALYDRLKNVDPGIFLNSRNKRFIGDILGNSSNVGNWIRTFVGGIITNIFVIIGVVTVLALINIWIFVVLIISSFLIYFIEKIKQKISEKQNLEDKYEYDEKIWILTEQMQQNLSYLMASGGFKTILSYYKKFNNQLRKRIKILQKRNLILNIVSFIIENISEIFVKIIVGYSIFFSTTSIGTMTLTLLYVGRINELFNFLRYLKFDINSFLDDLLKLDVFLDITNKKSKKNKYLKGFSRIEFKKLSFTYPNFAKEELRYLEIVEKRIMSYSSGKPNNHNMDRLHMIEEAKKEASQINPIILNELDLFFEVGKTYGIVGKNGAGKTTLISLLLNYFDDYKGDIFIDDIQLNKIKRDFFIDNVSIVSQIPYVINGFTIRENLLLGVSKKYTDVYILSLLDKFGLKKKVLKNRTGLDGKIGYENDFSGGEKQLLALIRVILQDKKILIMDEGTNQLDAENEELVMSELLKNKKDKIVIFITHRMTSIRKVDLIYCLENGKITDSGIHKKLVKGNNIYSNFWKKQVEE